MHKRKIGPSSYLSDKFVSLPNSMNVSQSKDSASVTGFPLRSDYHLKKRIGTGLRQVYAALPYQTFSI
jgi:hypothetical protein